MRFLCSSLPVLTFAQSVQLALQWAGVAQRAIPKGKLAPPLRPVSSLGRLRPLHPLPQGSPHYRLAFINHVHLRAPHVTPAPFALSGDSWSSVLLLITVVRVLWSAVCVPYFVQGFFAYLIK